jgi:hypothetical protein
VEAAHVAKLKGKIMAGIITPQKREAIRKRLIDGIKGQGEIAREFNVSESTVHKLKVELREETARSIEAENNSRPALVERSQPITLDNRAFESLTHMREDLPAPTNASPDPFRSAASQEFPDDPAVADYLNEEDEIKAIFAELGTEFTTGSVTITKRNVQTRKFEWLDKLAAADFLASGMPFLAQYGAGDYMLSIYAGGRAGVARRKLVTVHEAAGRREQAKVAAAQGISPAVAPEISALAEGLKQTQMLLAQLAQNFARPPQQEGIADRLKEYLMIQQAFGGANQNQNRNNDPFTMMKSVMDLVRDMQPPGEGAGGMMDLAEKFITKFGPLITKAVETAQEQAPALAPPAAQPLARPAQQPIARPGNGGISQTPEENEIMFQQQMLKFFLNTLISAASLNADPVTYADMILDQVPEEIVEKWIESEDLMRELAKHDPRVSTFPQWFAQLREAIVERRAEERGPGTPVGPQVEI